MAPNSTLTKPTAAAASVRSGYGYASNLPASSVLEATFQGVTTADVSTRACFTAESTSASAEHG